MYVLLSIQVEGETVLKFALCYGFRNLQNIVRKVKSGKCDYHFLEIMACPSGHCLSFTINLFASIDVLLLSMRPGSWTLI